MPLSFTKDSQTLEYYGLQLHKQIKQVQTQKKSTNNENNL